MEGRSAVTIAINEIYAQTTEVVESYLVAAFFE